MKALNQYRWYGTGVNLYDHATMFIYCEKDEGDIIIKALRLLFPATIVFPAIGNLRVESCGCNLAWPTGIDVCRQHSRLLYDFMDAKLRI